jgi:glycosyltransferase involved in cell wall biosynthesis
MRKIKLFLGGYVNYINAQNINCKAIAENIDKKRFEVLVMHSHFGGEEMSNVRSFYCFRPFFLSKQLGFLWGICNCDVAYLPKHIDTPLWVLRLAKLLKKKIFTTIEGNVVDQELDNLISLFGDYKRMNYHFSFFDKIYPISKFLYNSTKDIIQIEKDPLYLGVASDVFERNESTLLKEVVYIGGLIKRKQVHQILKLARRYNDLRFNIIGDGSERNKLEKESSDNVIFYGLLNHKEMNNILKNSQLMILPSKSEGFPKVILEAASAGIPSLVYSSYGVEEWIENNSNGFIVDEFNDMISFLDDMLLDNKILNKVSKNTIQLSEKFNWNTIIKNWEKIIIDLYNDK